MQPIYDREKDYIREYGEEAHQKALRFMDGEEDYVVEQFSLDHIEHPHQVLEALRDLQVESMFVRYIFSSPINADSYMTFFRLVPNGRWYPVNYLYAEELFLDRFIQ